MRTRYLLPGLLLLAAPAALAQAPPGAPRMGVPPETQEAPLSAEARATIEARVAASRDSLRRLGLLPATPARGAVTPLAWPIRAAAGVTDPGVHGISNFVDLNPALGALLDYSCGARTYDQPSGYNHAGIDIFTWPFGWQKMDRSEVEIVSAADGVIVAKFGGRPDRSCTFNGNTWNAVYVEHADGSIAWYGHMKNGSLTTLPVGAAVSTGDYLGVVGSSGNSTGPHLHFELRNAEGQITEPFAGACNTAVPASWWVDQRPYFDGAVNAARTHSAPPVFPTCPQTVEQTNEADAFAPGATVITAAYLRDVQPEQPIDLTFRRPDGSALYEWTFNANVTQFWPAVYWYWEIDLPADAPMGTWTWEVGFNGTSDTHAFNVGTVDAEGGPEAAALTLAVAPNPARGAARVALQLAEAGRATVEVLDPLGRVVARLHDGPLAGGVEHALAFDAAALPPGVYLVRALSDGAVTTRRMTITR
jgi:murein DD-endopeptidase MepM/ murein hydrolase activator NlpD